RDNQQFGPPEDALPCEVECAFASSLFTGGDHEGDAALERQLAFGLGDRRGYKCRDACLHVARSAPEELPVPNLSVERRHRPWFLPQRHDINVAGEYQGTGIACAA